MCGGGLERKDSGKRKRCKQCGEMALEKSSKQHVQLGQRSVRKITTEGTGTELHMKVISGCKQ